MKVTRREFVNGIGIILGGTLLGEGLLRNRIWSFPSKIVIPEFKQGKWTIEDDWTDSNEAYSVLFDTPLMPEKVDSAPVAMFEKLTSNGFAIMIPPELKQIAQQILSGMHNQRDRITLDMLKYSKFKYSQV